MATLTDFYLALPENGVYTINLAPPVPIGGMSFVFTMTRRPNGDVIVQKSMASGFYGVSGMNIVNSGQGTMSVTFNPPEVSGFAPGNYACLLQRVDSGSVTNALEGYRICNP